MENKNEDKEAVIDIPQPEKPKRGRPKQGPKPPLEKKPSGRPRIYQTEEERKQAFNKYLVTRNRLAKLDKLLKQLNEETTNETQRARFLRTLDDFYLFQLEGDI